MTVKASDYRTFLWYVVSLGLDAFPCVEEDTLHDDGVLVDDGRLLVVLLGVATQQHEVTLQVVEVFILQEREGGR